jgi:multisubunit Na+/H+ antiporter MnhC subunit
MMSIVRKGIKVAVLDKKGKILNNSRVNNNVIKVNEFFDTLHQAIILTYVVCGITYTNA